MSTLHEMFEEGLKDIYNAEKQMSKALPKLAKLAQNPELRLAIETHMGETEQHMKRLEEACTSIGIKPTGVVCHGMMGLVEEATEHTKGKKPSAATDAEIIAVAQKAEHYEIATYGTLCEWAKVMGHGEALRLMKLNMGEEERTDSLLTQMAESKINPQAARESGQTKMGDTRAKSVRAKMGSTRRVASKPSRTKTPVSSGAR